MPIPVGDLNFGVVEFDAESLAAALRPFITAGDGGQKISVDDLNIVQRTGTAIARYNTVAEALQNGTRLFDALAYFSIAEADRPVIAQHPLGDNETDPSLLEIGRGVYYVYMYILLRGHAPPNQAGIDTQPIPQFLRAVMGLNNPNHEYVNAIASFDLSLLDHSWIRYIQPLDLNRKTQNRLALGMAGYRIPTALTVFNFRTDASAEAITAATAVRNFVRAGTTWDCHSVTRSAAFLDVVKNFNGNCNNLLLQVYTDDEIQRLVTLRMLYAAPVENPQFIQWRTWTDATFAGFTDFIFRQ